MQCPFCEATDTKVIDSRLVGEGSQVRRRRSCSVCGERFTTYELAELVMPRVLKNDKTLAAFDEQKIRGGLLKALEKRPVDIEQIDVAVNHIRQRLRATGEREVPSSFIGECVMDELKQLDQVAFVRFASVYRSFEDVSAFTQTINSLKSVE